MGKGGFLLDPSILFISAGGGGAHKIWVDLRCHRFCEPLRWAFLWKVQGASQGTCITLWKVDVLWDASQADCPSSASSSLIQHFLSERKHSLPVCALGRNETEGALMLIG